MGSGETFNNTKRRKGYTIPSSDGEVSGPFFFAIWYGDDFILAKLQDKPADQSAPVASTSLASYHVRLLGPRETGYTPILIAPKWSTNWDTAGDALGYGLSTHYMTIAISRDKVAAIRELLVNERPPIWYQAKTRYAEHCGNIVEPHV